MNVSVLIPVGNLDEWRGAALGYVVAWYARHLPGARIFAGTVVDGEWSKGEAVRNALDAAIESGDGDGVLVLADADSFLESPEHLRRAVDLVTGGAPWVVPHGSVWRLTGTESKRIVTVPNATPRRGCTVRPVYPGIPGGGITVLTRTAFDTVGGIDPRFYGWGGEDVALGYALRTLVAPMVRLDGRLIHLWHPPATSDLRGSPASEELVGAYTAADGFPRRMREVIATGTFPVPLPPVTRPVPFAVKAKHVRRLKIGGTWIRFTAGRYDADDPDEIDALRRHPEVEELRT